MCGISGIFGGSQSSGIALERVARSLETLGHRGPDDVRYASIDNGAWGMCRLAIRDPRPIAMQPLWLDGHTGLIFNGEIYNTESLSKRLLRRGYSFQTQSDTEVLLAAYVEYGSSVWSMLDGIFAACVLDRRRGRIVLARDEFGVKPLYYRSTPGQLLIASDTRAIQALGTTSVQPNIETIAFYLRYQYIPEPESAVAGVHRVPPGVSLGFDLDSLLPGAPSTFRQSVEEDLETDVSIDALDDAIRESVRSQLVSDRPVGVFLSGGIDSTLVTSYAAELAPGIRAYGVSVPSWSGDERSYMLTAAEKLEVPLTIVDVTAESASNLVDAALDAYDEPFGDFSCLPTLAVSAAAGNDVRVVLTGDGGDELFGGYSRYKYARHADLAGRALRSRLFARALAPLRSGLEHRSVTFGRVSEEAGAGGHGYGGLMAVQSYDSVRALLDWDGRPPLLLPSGDAYKELGRRNRPLRRAMSSDISQYLPGDILTKVDRATMYYSLEARVPLLGARVARFAESAPLELKWSHGQGKPALKQLLRMRGFSEPFVRRPKRGFSIPIEEWLVPLMSGGVHREALEQPPDPLRPESCRVLLRLLLEGERVGHQVWCVLMLSHWLEKLKSGS